MKLIDFITKIEKENYSYEDFLKLKQEYIKFYPKWNYEYQAHTQPVTRDIVWIGIKTKTLLQLSNLNFKNKTTVIARLQNDIDKLWAHIKSMANDENFGL